MKVIALKNIKAYLPNKKTLFSIKNFSLEPDVSCLIRGPSGKGKTTFLHMLAGIYTSFDGEIQVLGENLKELKEPNLSLFRRKHISLIFQKLNLIEHFNVRENISVGSLEAKEEEIKKALQLLGLSEKEILLTSKLSLGEQQRVAVARSLVSAPSLLLADEPTSSLDKANTEAVISGIMGMKKKTSIIVVSHDDRIEKYFDKVVDFGDLCDQ